MKKQYTLISKFQLFFEPTNQLIVLLKRRSIFYNLINSCGELSRFRQTNSQKFVKSHVFVYMRPCIVKIRLQLSSKYQGSLDSVVTWFPDLEFTCRSYSKFRLKLLLFHASRNSSYSSGFDIPGSSKIITSSDRLLKCHWFTVNIKRDKVSTLQKLILSWYN